MAVERLAIGSPPRRLDGVLDVPAGARAGAVVCHPHPQYGGNMDNEVVVAVAAALAARGHAVLRFNFGGVGRSQGEYGGGEAELGDLRAAIDALRHRLPPAMPLLLAGYSFGAWVALRVAGDAPGVTAVVAVAPPLAFFDWGFLNGVPVPVTFVVGDGDQYCPAGRLRQAVTDARATLRTIAGADHFFVGREDEVAGAAY
jgi:alpha/beta superfamily hydrolase